MPQARKRKSSDKNQHFQNLQTIINIIISIINNEPFPERHLLPYLFSKPVWIRFLPSLFLLFLLLHLNTRQHRIHERRWSRVNDEQNWEDLSTTCFQLSYPLQTCPAFYRHLEGQPHHLSVNLITILRITPLSVFMGQMIGIIIGIVRKKDNLWAKVDFFLRQSKCIIEEGRPVCLLKFFILHDWNVACSSLFSLLSLPDGFGQGESKVVKLRIGAKTPPFHLASLIDPNSWPVLLS